MLKTRNECVFDIHKTSNEVPSIGLPDKITNSFGRFSVSSFLLEYRSRGIVHDMFLVVEPLVQFNDYDLFGTINERYLEVSVEKASCMLNGAL